MIDLDIVLYLASQSPRRRALLKELGFKVNIVKAPDIDEIYPEYLTAYEIPLYLAKLKAESYTDLLPEKAVLITADTIVWLDNRVLGKPANLTEAKDMLLSLSSKMHKVYTGVCLKKGDYCYSFYDETDVFFKTLTKEEIEYYVDKFQPVDKAGAYGVQEWIGFIGVERINGSYFNVMGLPTHKLYNEIIKIVSK
jgi:septum formation protein